MNRKTRKFNGKLYHRYFRVFLLKSQAESEARVQRRRGGLARVTKEKSISVVWVRARNK